MTGRQRPGRLQGLSLGLTVLGCAYAAGLVVCERALPEHRLIAFLLVHAPQPPLLLPLALPLLVAALGRRTQLLWANLAVLVVAAAILVPPVLPHRAPRPEPGQTVRVVTWNVHQEEEQVATIGATLEELRPDVVCMQEAVPEVLAKALPGTTQAFTHEVRTLVRGRLVRQQAIPLSDPRHYRWGIVTEVELPQGRLSVLNVHYVVGMKSRVRAERHDRPDPINIVRERQNEAVLRWLRETEGPRLVCGDFNMPPGVDLYDDLAGQATNAFEAAGWGWGFTYPRRLPLLRIDHIWCAGGAVPVWCRTRDGVASDHRLVVADIRLPGRVR